MHLCEFQKLDEIYQNYEAYVSASCGETFGITLMEAIGSVLPIVCGVICHMGCRFLWMKAKMGLKSPTFR